MARYERRPGRAKVIGSQERAERRGDGQSHVGVANPSTSLA